MPEGSPDHHAPTQIQTPAHRPAAAGGHQINGTINVTNPDTVALGPGIATPVSNDGDTILSTADVNGIRIGGLLFDAGTTNSAQLVQIGPAGSSACHASDPTVLSDVFARIGGATVGKATQTLVVNSGNVIGDDLWLWRADHGNGGTDHFYQSELPYDPPNQSSWMDGSSNGYPSINVANSVTAFRGYGLGVYCCFSTNSGVVSANALASPTSSGVQWHDMVTVSPSGVGTISHIIDNTGGTVNSGSTVADLTSYN